MDRAGGTGAGAGVAAATEGESEVTAGHPAVELCDHQDFFLPDVPVDAAKAERPGVVTHCISFVPACAACMAATPKARVTLSTPAPAPLIVQWLRRLAMMLRESASWDRLMAGEDLWPEKVSCIPECDPGVRAAIMDLDQALCQVITPALVATYVHIRHHRLQSASDKSLQLAGILCRSYDLYVHIACGNPTDPDIVLARLVPLFVSAPGRPPLRRVLRTAYPSIVLSDVRDCT
jgi:hypothetical protein